MILKPNVNSVVFKIALPFHNKEFMLFYSLISAVISSAMDRKVSLTHENLVGQSEDGLLVVCTRIYYYVSFALRPRLIT